MNSRGEFVTHVSHELKAPLASMQETIQILLEEIPGSINERQERLLKLTLQSGSRLTSMIGNLLDLAKTDAGIIEYELESRDLVPLVESVVEEIEAQAKEKQIQIKTSFPDAPLPVMCDGERIKEVLINLLVNSCEAMGEGGLIVIREEEGVAEPLGRVVVIRVKDSGPGIPKIVFVIRYLNLFLAPKKRGRAWGSALPTAL